MLKQFGIVNLERHVNNIRKFGVEPVIALNAFIHDTDLKLKSVKAWAKENNVRIALTEVWEKGGKGGVELANQVLEVIEQPNDFKFLYDLDQSLEEKLKQSLKISMVVLQLHLVKS